MQLRLAASVAAIGLAAFAAPSHAALSFSPFVTTGDLDTVLQNNSTIGFAYAGDKFVGSVYYGANNDQLYSTNLTGGGVAKFGAPLGNNFGGEIYVTASLGIGGYGPRDVFAGSQNGGTIMRIAHDGSSQGVFATGLVGGVRSLAFDPFGLYGNQLIAATNQGNIYTISNTGVPTLLASVGEDTEGLSFTQQAFGPYAAGTLFVASEGSGTLRAIAAGPGHAAIRWKGSMPPITPRTSSRPTPRNSCRTSAMRSSPASSVWAARCGTSTTTRRRRPSSRTRSACFRTSPRTASSSPRKSSATRSPSPRPTP